MCDCGKKKRDQGATYTPSNKHIHAMTQLPQGFNWKIYQELNPDLTNAGFNTEQNIMHHWYTYGLHENRTYSAIQVTPDFNWKIYKELNPDIIFDYQIDYELHWIQNGRIENRKYQIN